LPTQPFQPAVRVVVADSSPITSQLIAEAIGKNPQIDVVGFGSAPAEVIAMVENRAPDILLISALMQEEQNRGLRILRELRPDRRGLKAVVLLDSRHPQTVISAFRAGASGVFCRTAPVELLPKCLIAVSQGQIWANSEELAFLVEAVRSGPFQTTEPATLKQLSAREREVVRYLAEGLTNRQIAEMLKISRHTVKNYIFNVFEKLGVCNRVELAFYVSRYPTEFTVDEEYRRAGSERQAGGTHSAADKRLLRPVPKPDVSAAS
jgi:two-component system, NarL family, nitrate/nitrite response regulator NarL